LTGKLFINPFVAIIWHIGIKLLGTELMEISKNIGWIDPPYW
jgi:hypothetical protein